MADDSVGVISLDIDVNSDIKSQITNTVESIAQQINNQATEVSNTVSGVVSNIISNIQGSTEQLNNEIQTIGQEQRQVLESALSAVSNTATNTNQSINNQVNATTENIRQNCNNINQQASEISNTVTNANQNINSQVNETTQNIRRNCDNISQQTEEVSDTVQQSSNKIKDLLSNAFSNAFSKIKKTVNKEGESVSKNLAKTFMSSAANIKAMFDMALGTVQAFISSVSGLMSANQTQIEAEARLGATMRNTTSATDEQIQSIKDLASELQGLGVVGDEVQLAGMQELATYVEDVESLKTMLPVLDDMIAQQYGYNATTDSAVTISTMLGKVLQGQTSALSRYGYTFDEAQEQLLKYGTEEQRVATLAEVVSESVGGVNRALADTPTGKIKQLSNDFGDLQETLGSLITNVLSPIAKWLDVIVQKLNNLFSSVNEKVKGFLGIAEEKNVGGLTAEIDDTADSLENAEDKAKKLKNRLSGFDDLNILADNDTDESDEDITPTMDGLESGLKSSENIVDSITDKLKTIGEGLGFTNFFKEIQKGFDSVNWETIKNNVDSIFSDLKPIAQTSFKGLEKVAKSSMTTFGKIIGGTVSVTGKSLQTVTGGIAKWLDKDKEKISDGITLISDNISGGIDSIGIFSESVLGTLGESIDRMRPMMESAIADFLSGFTTLGISIEEVFSEAFLIVTENLAQWAEDNKDLLGNFFDGTQQNMASFLETIGYISEQIGNSLSSWWEEKGVSAFDGFVATILDVGATLMSWYTEYIQPVFDWITGTIQTLWNEHLSWLWNNILDFISSVMEFVSALWNFIKPFVNFIAQQFLGELVSVFKSVWGWITTLFGFVTDVVAGVIKMLQGILDFFTGIFTGDLEKAVMGIFEVIQGFLEIVWGAIKAVINIIIDGINLLWTGIYNAISNIVNGFSGIAETVGSLFGQDWSFRMPTEAPLIPHLAKGGLVKAPTLALVGDNAGANTGNPEVIAPLSKLQGMLNESDGSKEDTVILSKILQYLIKIYEFMQNSGGNVYEFIAQVNGNILFKQMIEENEKYKKRHGGRSAFV